MELFRRSHLLMRSTALLVLFFYSFVFYSPAALAVKQEQERQQQKDAIVLEGNSKDAKLANGLQQLKERVSETRQIIHTKSQQKKNVLEMVMNWFGTSLEDIEALDKLNELNTQIEALNKDVLADFQATEADLNKRKVSKTILQRHQSALVTYQQHYDEMQSHFKDAMSAQNVVHQKVAIDKFDSFLSKQKFQKGHQAIDPTQPLPFGVRKSDVRAPLMDDLALYQITHEPVLVAATTLQPGMVPPLGPKVAPTADDLAATIDAQQTDEIKALATQLNNNPTEIYAWVHNNIRFIPSYGSIQGAQQTLDTKRGNAMDTASLLIALLRASNIPARYAYGTVEIPINDVMNWVGGVTSLDAAFNLMGQGGIPSIALKTGSRITHARIEHTWVEAWVDFEPSRGVQKGAGDTWIPLDASFKTYDYTQGTDLQAAVPFDAQALVDTIQQQSTVNETEGWVQNVPQQAIQDALTQYQNQLKTYLETQAPDATVGDVLGLQTIKVHPPRPFASGLPYKLKTTKQIFSTIADSMRLKFKFELFTNDYGSPGNTLFKVEEPTVKLAGQKLALSFKPATQEDADLIASYLPEPDVNGYVDPAQLPKTLPGYLIDLTGEFTLGNTVVAAASMASPMGTELVSQMGYKFPGSTWNTSQNLPIAGEYQAIALDLQGASLKQAEKLKANLLATHQLLLDQDVDQATKHGVVGDLLFLSSFAYFALNSVIDDLSARQMGFVQYRSPSYGLFQSTVTTNYFYGVPRSVEDGGNAMDVDSLVHLVVEKSNDKTRWKQFIRMTGARESAMESLVPENLYSSSQNVVEGFSAVKALQVAAQQGQKIWEINGNNINTALAAINLDTKIESEIRSAVASGKVVTTHTSDVFSNGIKAAGYLILDPETGAGAYKVSGGLGGALLQGLALGIMQGIAPFILVSAPLIAIAGLAGLAAGLIMSYNGTTEEQLNFNGGRLVGMMAGFILSVIIGQVASIALSPLFLIGALLLALNVARLIMIEIVTSVSLNQDSNRNRKTIYV